MGSPDIADSWPGCAGGDASCVDDVVLGPQTALPSAQVTQEGLEDH